MNFNSFHFNQFHINSFSFQDEKSYMTRYQIRLRRDASRHREKRAQETQGETLRRRTADASRHREQRAHETEEAAFQRTQRDTDWHRLNRQSSPERQREQTRNVQRRTRRARNSIDLAMAGFDYKGQDFEGKKPDIGEMNIVCKHCKALKWPGETPSLCCHNGKKKPPLIEDPPEYLKTLLKGESRDSKRFLGNIMAFNRCFNMTSFGAGNIVKNQGYDPSFKIQGQVYHRIGSFIPEEGAKPSFVQIFFMGDQRQQLDRRCEISPNVDHEIITQLQEMLHEKNELVRRFKTLLEKEGLQDDAKIIIRADKVPQGAHRGTANAPVVDEVAIIMTNEGQAKERDIILTLKGGQLQRISEFHKSYDALQYPLMFWKGQDSISIKWKEAVKISTAEYYSYLFMVREGLFNHLHRYRKLFQMFAVDGFCKLETERLGFLGREQIRLRASEYKNLRQGLIDATEGDGQLGAIGKRTILPSSFTGGPRYMHKKMMDAMCYVRKFGKPSLFITLTCNPTWPEITRALMEGQKPEDRPDITARVFKLKVGKLQNLLRKGEFFGEFQAYVHTIEWQKRGLPHAHILLWLKEPIHPRDVDRIISAELPKKEDELLYKIITTQMIHGPCGPDNPKSPCMKDGKCSKDYPRRFIKETNSDRDGYPEYRRRHPNDGGQETIVEKGNPPQKFIINNTHVVPHNPALCKLFNAHINVELCSSIKSIKYVTKYITKGSDIAVYGVQGQVIGPHDEIGLYKTGRYAGSNEAMWRLFCFSIHEHYPPVEYLQIHLENMQVVTYDPSNTTLEDIDGKDTKLTAFFKLCNVDKFAKTLTYPDVPSYFSWEHKTREWKRRAKGTPVENWPRVKKNDSLGRVYTVHPNQQEAFYLRMLLHRVEGPTSFSSIRTVNGHEYATFRDACHKLGLIQDDSQYHSAMAEAFFEKSPSALRDLFCIIISSCDVANPMQLWINHKDDLCEDIMYQTTLRNPGVVLDENAIANEALIKIEDKLLQMCGHGLKHFGLPEVDRAPHALTHEVLREKSYDLEQLRQYVEENEDKLTTDQRKVYDEVLENLNDGGLWFLDAPGGTGKTFLSKLLLSKVRSMGHIALAVASSGIASTLLPGGRTAHSTFKLPLNLIKDDKPICNLSMETSAASVLRQAKLIIWDECTMSHKRAFEAVDRLMQDIHSNTRTMGGTLLLMTGDFRQTLPVIPKGTKADEIDASIKASDLWKHVEKLNLKTNMRVFLNDDADAGAWADILLDIGDGILGQYDGYLKPPPHVCVSSKQDLINAIFPNLAENYKSAEWLGQRLILAPKNADVDSINDELLSKSPGVVKIYRSVDKVEKESEATEYPTEFLNSLTPPGVPPHCLTLKKGCPVILLRNLDPPRLCNGTRLILTQLNSHTLNAKILSGEYEGQDVTIPRIPFIPSDFPFEFKRTQFPIKLSYALSINKAQGQTLKTVGLCLETDCFSHGQFYVGVSRVGLERNLKIYAPSGKTKNVVYQEAFSN